VEDYKGDDGDRGGKKYARVEREGNQAEKDTSFGSEYIPEDNGSSSYGTNSESLETEPEFSDAGDGKEIGEGSCIERRSGSSTVSKLEVLWRAFEEENMIDSSGSDFEGADHSGAEDSDEVSLVEELDMGDIVADASGAGEDREGSEGEGRSGRCNASMRKKVVHCEERTLQRKARGDGVVLGLNPLKGEKGRVVIVKGRCTL